MLKQITIEPNKQEIKQIAEANAIEYIGLFGSYARGEQTKESDLDLYIKFDFSKKQIGLFQLYKIQKLLEKSFKQKIDIVTNPNHLVMPYIQKDLIKIYEK